MLRVLLRSGMFLIVLVGSLNAQSRNLEIYWIDVEGGAATLVVAPSGESLLVDAGYAVDDRDAKRIHAAAQQAGLKKIDSFVLSHYHGDHVGGLTALAKMMPIDRYFDHGDDVEDVDRERLDIYRKVAGNKRTILKAGDVIPLKDVRVDVVASNAQFIAKPLSGGGPNPLCAMAERKEPAGPENARTIGAMLTYGRFKFVNLTDLDWANEMALTCPVNKLGTVTIWQADRHGSLHGAGAPALLGAIKPQIIVVNNGPRKGLGQVDKNARSITNPGRDLLASESYQRIAKLPGVEDVWQGHLSLLTERAHNTADNLIANFEDTADCKGHWIKASVAPDGRFTITNGRNGFSKTYRAR